MPALPVVGEGRGPQLGRLAVGAAVLELEVDPLARTGRQGRGVLAVPPEAYALERGPVVGRPVEGEVVGEAAPAADVERALQDLGALGRVGALGEPQRRVVVGVAAPGEDALRRRVAEGDLPLEPVDGHRCGLVGGGRARQRPGEQPAEHRDGGDHRRRGSAPDAVPEAALVSGAWHCGSFGTGGTGGTLRSLHERGSRPGDSASRNDIAAGTALGALSARCGRVNRQPVASSRVNADND